MPLAVYQKAPPSPPPQSPTCRPTHTQRLLKLTPSILITLGSLLIANVAWPILHYGIFVSPQLTRAELITPININRTAYITPIGASNPKPQNSPQEVLSQEIDYTKPSNWFPRQQYQAQKPPTTNKYLINIPKINIQNATVEIGGEDLSQSLIHYPGTANPGQLGSPVIFGHSVLRQFYNPSIDNPRRYISIFSKIMTLKQGDEIFVDYDGIRYRYLVTDKYEVKPEDVYILQQRYNQSQLKLVTCVPEGTYLRRGVITATLTDINQPEATVAE